MANYSTNQFKNGLKLILDGNPCTIIENEKVKPGKGQAFNRVKLKDLVTGKMLVKTFKSGESLPGAEVMEVEMQYLYNDGQLWHFMHPDSFEQYALDEASLTNTKWYLVEQDYYLLTLWNDEPIAVTPPNHILLKVADTDPGLKGDSTSSVTKPATMSTGLVVQVPLFINIDDLLKIDSRSNEYISRA